MHKYIKSFLLSIVCFFLLAPATSALFIDVVEQSLFYDAVTYFTTEVPIIDQGRERFKPLDKATKAEFFKLMLASGGYIPSFQDILDVPYHDVVGTEWFAPYVKQSLDIDLIHVESEDPNFHPGSIVTRAEGLALILRYYGFDISQAQQIEQKYLDVSSTDSYANIAKIALELQLLSDYKSNTFSASKELTRAETVHILYQLHINGITTPISDLSTIPVDETFILFYEVFDKIITDFIDKNNISEDDLIYGAISGMVMSLNDPYSVFFEPVDSISFQESLEGAFDGIGIYLNYENEQYIIVTPLKGSPAEEAGLKPNDIILEVDGVSVNKMTLDELVNVLRGPSGTLVKLKIQRKSSIYNFSVTRAHIDIPFVESEMINNVGIIYYYQFTSNSNQQFNNEIDALLQQNPKGLILDLRNNPGGFLFSAQQLVSRFMPALEPYVNLTLSDGYTFAEKSFGPGDLKDIPLVILINEGSASASEIAALALQEKASASIVGKQSYGKGKIQEIVTYIDGSSLKLSIAKWTSPNGIYIGEIGITPDYDVELTENDVLKGNDPQLQKALSIIR